MSPWIVQACIVSNTVVPNKEVAATPTKKTTSFLETPVKQAAPKKLFEQEVAAEKLAEEKVATPSTEGIWGEEFRIAIGKLANHFHSINMAKKAELAAMSVQGGAEHDDDDDDDKVVDAASLSSPKESIVVGQSVAEMTSLSSPRSSIVVGHHVVEMPQIHLFAELAEKEAKLDTYARESFEQLDVASAAEILERASAPRIRNFNAYVQKATKTTLKEQADWEEYWGEEGDGDEGGHSEEKAEEEGGKQEEETGGEGGDGKGGEAEGEWKEGEAEGEWKEGDAEGKEEGAEGEEWPEESGEGAAAAEGDDEQAYAGSCI